MAPPSSLWVQRYLREHNLDALLAEAVNQAVAERSTDPAASLALYFTRLSKRNGEITKLFARRILNMDLKPALELCIECFYNGESRLASTTVGQVMKVVEPPSENLDEEAEDAAAEEEEGSKNPEEAVIDGAVTILNDLVQGNLVGLMARDTRDVDEKIKEVDKAPATLTSLAVADAAAFIAQEPLFLFVASLLGNLKAEADGHIGGGVAVQAGLGEDSLSTEKSRLGENSGEAGTDEGGEEGQGASTLAVPTLSLPAPLFPAFTAGPSVPDCKVKLRSFMLVGKRDGALREVLPQLISAYTHLETVAAAKLEEGQTLQKLADGSFACGLEDVAQVMGVLGEAVEAAGLTMGEEVTVSINFGASSFFISNTGEVGSYAYQPEEGDAVEADSWAEWVCAFLDKYPQVSSILDVCAEEDYETWRKVRQAVEARGTAVTLLGSDIFKNDLDLIRTGVAEGWAGGALLASERLRTLTDILDAASLFTFLKPRASRVILEHRPGHSAGVIEADLAVGIGAWGLVCAPPGPMAVSKYNRLIEIERTMEALQAEGALVVKPWTQLYEEEEAAVAAYAEQVAEAEQGP